jgi:hypothetical protein
VQIHLILKENSLTDCSLTPYFKFRLYYTVTAVIVYQSQRKMNDDL